MQTPNVSSGLDYLNLRHQKNMFTPKNNEQNQKATEIRCRPKLWRDTTIDLTDEINETTIYSWSKSRSKFNDGVRSIDYVLVWDRKDNSSISSQAFRQRKMFEMNLKKQGLELEYENPDDLFNHFIKIHVPVKVLRRFSEVLKIRMPLKDAPLKRDVKKSRNIFAYIWNFLMSSSTDSPAFPRKEHHLTAIYSRDKDYLFDTTSEFWSPLVRLRIVQYILDREKFAPGILDFGISRLLSNKTYCAAYPLHDGCYKTPGSMRYKLYTEWANMRKCLKFQPLDYIKDYFGVKVGLYFAWLGFYTMMLIPASIVGLICFFYAVVTFNNHIPSKEICNYSSTIKMCPPCDLSDYYNLSTVAPEDIEICDFWDLKQTCQKVKVSYLFDNWATVYFAGFMNIWAVCFLELWKRYSAEITYRWDLTGFDLYEEHPRPQYMAEVKRCKNARTQLNEVTGYEEPVAPFWRVRFPATLFSYSVIILLILVVIASVIGIVLYRTSLRGTNFLTNQNMLIPMDPKIFVSITAAIINFLFILVFGYIYQRLAKWLTEKELLRTQKEFEDSLTFKIYVLQFVNYYSSIFYIAFFKGKFVGRPGAYKKLFGQRQLECASGGCLLELSINLAIIMIGNQIQTTVKEMAKLYSMMWWKTFRANSKNKKKNSIRDIVRKDTKSPHQWIEDYKLVDVGDMGIFNEYLEMVRQFGLITIFVAAFPLAPLFALISNVCEMRVDAKKFVRCYRRTVPQRVNDIGIWFRILNTIKNISVITNGFIIAFTSDFIPQLYYMYFMNNPDLTNYVEFTMSKFNVSLLHEDSLRLSNYTESQCHYPQYSYYEPLDTQEKASFWQLMTLRICFVVAFENVTALVMVLFRCAIPTLPSSLRYRIRRENYVTNNLILEHSRSLHETDQVIESSYL